VLTYSFLGERACEEIGLNMQSANFPLAFPAKAGTHCSTTLNFWSNRNALRARMGSCRGTIGPGFRRKRYKLAIDDFFTRSKAEIHPCWPLRISHYQGVKGSCNGAMGPGFRRGGEKMIAEEILHTLAAVQNQIRRFNHARDRHTKVRPENLVIKEIPNPEPKPGHVVIQVKAFGINHAEMHMRTGEWAEAAEVSGIECVGLVNSCPGGEFAVGTKIAALMGGMGRTINGSYAEYTRPPAANVAQIESELPWEELAAIPESYATA
jgi:hypothetical protein